MTPTPAQTQSGAVSTIRSIDTIRNDAATHRAAAESNRLRAVFERAIGAVALVPTVYCAVKGNGEWAALSSAVSVVGLTRSVGYENMARSRDSHAAPLEGALATHELALASHESVGAVPKSEHSL